MAHNTNFYEFDFRKICNQEIIKILTYFTFPSKRALCSLELLPKYT